MTAPGKSGAVARSPSFGFRGSSLCAPSPKGAVIVQYPSAHARRRGSTVEQLICNQWVAGSIPVAGSTKTKGQGMTPWPFCVREASHRGEFVTQLITPPGSCRARQHGVFAARPVPRGGTAAAAENIQHAPHGRHCALQRPPHHSLHVETLAQQHGTGYAKIIPKIHRSTRTRNREGAFSSISTPSEEAKHLPRRGKRSFLPDRSSYFGDFSEEN